MQNIIGVVHRETLIVDNETAINFLGHPDARILGTPWMILWMERTARNAVKPLLPEGWDTVGTVVNIRHLAAAPMGSEVIFEAEVIEQTEKRINFRVEARCGEIVIGDGTHERAPIDVHRFAARVAKSK